LNVTAAVTADMEWQITKWAMFDTHGKFSTYDGSWNVQDDTLAWNDQHQGLRLVRLTGSNTAWVSTDGTGWYDNRHRVYSPTMMRFAQQDPMGYVDGLSRYKYVADNPINKRDPSGLDPNREDAIDQLTMVNQAKGFEHDYPTETQSQILSRMLDLYKARDKYIYTTAQGWMDLQHFFRAAWYSQGLGVPVTEIGGVLVEVGQAVFGHTILIWKPVLGSSAFNYEDLPSNHAGAVFGRLYKDGSCFPPLSAQLEAAFKILKAQHPESAPNWLSLPATEEEHEMHWLKQEWSTPDPNPIYGDVSPVPYTPTW
jgi:RHS repeat-associated protein